MISWLSSIAVSQLPSRAARRANSTSWRRGWGLVSVTVLFILCLANDDGICSSSGIPDRLPDQIPGAGSRNADVDELTEQVALVVDVNERVAPRATGPTALRRAVDEDLDGVAEAPG